MPQRDELFRKFGPLLTECILSTMRIYINQLRVHQGMQPLTPQDVLDMVEEQLSGHEPYDWMTEEII